MGGDDKIQIASLVERLELESERRAAIARSIGERLDTAIAAAQGSPEGSDAWFDVRSMAKQLAGMPREAIEGFSEIRSVLEHVERREHDPVVWESMVRVLEVQALEVANVAGLLRLAEVCPPLVERG